MHAPLVTTTWLVEHLADPKVRVVDIRGHVLPATEPPPHYFNHYADYLVSHIPGAVFIDWVHEITDPSDPRHAKVAPPERFAEVMSRCGVDDQTFVVAYDDAQGMFAARLWWALNYYGHPKVAVLDGGWQKWIAEGLPVTEVLPAVRPTTFFPHPNLDWIRTQAEVLAVVRGEMPATLLDVRSAQEFAGLASRARRAGHIPGALNLPRTDLIAADGTLLPAEALRARLAALGVNDPSTPLITYCNAGVSASFALLALRVAGFACSAVYDGSWKEWGNDMSLPIA
ncbi:MAG: sulfurtransferase [Anaerolineae bacterium]|nr:sulfurtransferase [Thermoflexales bacterium]MDW8395805.1 sulfurtransferase [Anaerolineae bacterium]